MNEPILFAAGGALAIKLMDLAELSNVPIERRPDLKDFFYWLPFLILPLVGGFLAYAYANSGTVLTPILAINIGASAPLILKSLASTIPPISGQ